jgi:translation initiation factor 2B subunit (eIF-2B alpha/beta/delta family)
VTKVVKISKESLEAFQSTLETVDTSWQTEFNLRETIRQSFDLIKKAKEHKVSWEKIAEILKQSSGTTEGISPESIRQYYFEFSKKPDLLPQKKRRSGQNKKKLKSSTSVGSGSKIEKVKPESLDINQSIEFQASDIPPVQNSMPVTSSSDPKVDSQLVKPEPDRKAKEDVRSQFNLGRRGK